MFDFHKYYEVESNIKVSDWVVERCVGPKDTLNTVVPSGFSGYARICHPFWYVDAIDQDDEESWKALRAGWVDMEKMHPVRWSEIAKQNDHIAHRLMASFQIWSNTQHAPGSAGIGPPLEGCLTKGMVKEIFEILISLHGESQEVQCAFWEGFNISEYLCAKEKFESSPGLGYHYLFKSSLSMVRDGWMAVLKSIEDRRSIGTNGLAPNSIWASDKSWFLAVPFNLTSSYIGGSEELIGRISSSLHLETYEVFPGDKIFIYKK